MSNKIQFEMLYALEIDGREVIPVEEEWTATVSIDEETLRLMAKAIKQKPTGRISDLPKKYFKILFDAAQDAALTYCCDSDRALDVQSGRLMLWEQLSEGLVALLPADVQDLLKGVPETEDKILLPLFPEKNSKKKTTEEPEPELAEVDVEPVQYLPNEKYWIINEHQEPTKDNTLYLTIKQVYFDEIMDGSKKIEYRELKDTTYRRFLEVDKDGYVYYLTALVSKEDQEQGVDFITWNHGVCPLVPKQSTRYLNLAVGYHKERDTALVELAGYSFELDAFDEKDNFAIWTICLHIKRVVECHRH